MINGILGKKLGMTQVFEEDGRMVPVTVIQAGPCVITQVKTKVKDGYDGVQVGFVEEPKRNKPLAGHMKASGGSFRHLGEVPIDMLGDAKVGNKLTVEIFAPGDKVTVVGTSKGRGFAGTVKRHHFQGGPRTHGESDRTRAPGSIGNNTFPARIWKGKRMAGHLGDVRVTQKNLRVVRIDPERNLLLLRGAVPGAPNAILTIRRARGAEAKES